jgi:hypothetical protein
MKLTGVSLSTLEKVDKYVRRIISMKVRRKKCKKTFSTGNHMIEDGIHGFKRKISRLHNSQ